MPFVFHCKICDIYDTGLKPLYRFATEVEKHFIKRHPDCGDCPIQDLCVGYNQNQSLIEDYRT